MQFELKQITPDVTRAAVIRDTTQGSGTSQLAAIQAVAPSLRVEVNPINTRDAPEIERAVAAFGRSPNGGLIVTGSALAMVHRDLIVTLAARHKLPAVYWDRARVTGGGVISYGPDLVDQHRQAARYVDRILKGEKPADLPIRPCPTPVRAAAFAVLRLTTKSYLVGACNAHLQCSGQPMSCRSPVHGTPSHWRCSRRGKSLEACAEDTPWQSLPKGKQSPWARALAASEWLSASVRFRAVTGRPSRQLPRLGCARCGSRT
jgi:hypothetical protein